MNARAVNARGLERLAPGTSAASRVPVSIIGTSAGTANSRCRRPYPNLRNSDFTSSTGPFHIVIWPLRWREPPAITGCNSSRWCCRCFWSRCLSLYWSWLDPFLCAWRALLVGIRRYRVRSVLLADRDRSDDAFRSGRSDCGQQSVLQVAEHPCRRPARRCAGLTRGNAAVEVVRRVLSSCCRPRITNRFSSMVTSSWSR